MSRINSLASKRERRALRSRTKSVRNYLGVLPDRGVKRVSRLAQLLACRSFKQVVALLRKARVKRCDFEDYGADSCPIAKYLNPRGINSVSITPETIGFGDERIDTTRAVRTFVRRFDNGKFPEFCVPGTL